MAPENSRDQILGTMARFGLTTDDFRDCWARMEADAAELAETLCAAANGDEFVAAVNSRYRAEAPARTG